MSTIRLTITVDDLETVLTLYDQIKIYRSTTGITGTYSEHVDSPLTLAAGQSVYTFTDTTGDPTYYYKTSYYHSVSTLESDLSDPVKGEGSGDYVTVQDLRDNGIPNTVLTDTVALEKIKKWEQFFERATGQFFIARDKEVILDGTNSRVLYLPIPIISVSALYMNSDTDAADSDYYRVYSNREPPSDDRLNPKILIIQEQYSIYRGRASTRFLKGYDQTVTGTFGYVESDGSTPLPVKHAIMRLVALDSKDLSALTGESQPVSLPTGGIVEEKTDGHSRKYSDPQGKAGSNAARRFYLTGDAEVDRTIAMYRRPNTVRAVLKDWQPWSSQI